jgi:hypothetical protein
LRHNFSKRHSSASNYTLYIRRPFTARSRFRKHNRFSSIKFTFKFENRHVYVWGSVDFHSTSFLRKWRLALHVIIREYNWIVRPWNAQNPPGAKSGECNAPSMNRNPSRSSVEWKWWTFRRRFWHRQVWLSNGNYSTVCIRNRLQIAMDTSWPTLSLPFLFFQLSPVSSPQLSQLFFTWLLSRNLIINADKRKRKRSLSKKVNPSIGSWDFFRKLCRQELGQLQVTTWNQKHST